jgi:hypothetical protein
MFEVEVKFIPSGTRGKRPRDTRIVIATDRLHPRLRQLQAEGHAASASAKLDGTCARVENGILMKKRDLKPGRSPPEGWMQTDQSRDGDAHRIGFVPVDEGDVWFKDARVGDDSIRVLMPDGTMGERSLVDLSTVTLELLGPKVQGNPHNLQRHCFYLHGSIQLDNFPCYGPLDRVKDWFKADTQARDLEGVVLNVGGELFKVTWKHLEMLDTAVDPSTNNILMQ